MRFCARQTQMYSGVTRCHPVLMFESWYQFIGSLDLCQCRASCVTPQGFGTRVLYNKIAQRGWHKPESLL